MTSTSSITIIHQRTAHGPAASSHRVRTKTMPVFVCLFGRTHLLRWPAGRCDTFRITCRVQVGMSASSTEFPKACYQVLRRDHIWMQTKSPTQADSNPNRDRSQSVKQTFKIEFKCDTASRLISKQQARWRLLRMDKWFGVFSEKA